MTELPFTHIIPGMDSSELIWVEGGTFMMGSDNYDHEKPIHKVTVPSFAMGKYPVTQELWTVVMGNNPSHFIGDKRPVEHVSIQDAQRFLQEINLDSRLQHGQSFRLPSEAEWEYAARGGSKSENFPYIGGDKLDAVAWYDGNSHGETKDVGLKLPNELGFYDMSGNIREWCEDNFFKDYKDAPNNGSAWMSTAVLALWILRGSSSDDNSDGCRPASRFICRRTESNSFLGFRVVLSPFQDYTLNDNL